MHTCANCGRTIGTLEQAYKWNDNIVCASCYGVLRQCERIATDSQKAKKPYIDQMRVPRYTMLMVAIAFSVLPAMTGENGTDMKLIVKEPLGIGSEVI